MFTKVPFCLYQYPFGYTYMSEHKMKCLVDSYVRRHRGQLWLAMFDYIDARSVSPDDSFYHPEKVQFHVR